MKIQTILALLALSAGSAYAQFSLSGTALLKTPGTEVTDFGLVLIDVNGVGFSNATINLTAGENLSVGSSFGNFVVIVAPKLFQGNATTWAFNASVSGVAFENGISTGDRFAIITFDTSSTTALAADSFRVWTDSTWLVPAAGNGLTFSTSGNAGTVMQLGTASSPALIGTVAGSAIPEPASASLVAGLAFLGLASTRRRRK